jgi:predicted nucleic acid-binding protein
LWRHWQGLCTSGIVVNETLFVIARTKAFNKLGIKTPRAFRKHIAEQGYSFCEDEFKDFYDLLELLEFHLFQDHFDKDEVMRIITQFKILPTDAVIAATCRHYGIQKIATFDGDLLSKPWNYPR